MKKRVGVLTQDLSLYNRIKLLLRNVASVDLLDPKSSLNLYDVIFTDIDSSDSHPDNALTMSYDKKADIALPFLHADVLNVVERAEQKNSEKIALLNDGRHALLFGEKIKLTEVEYKLLFELLSAEGKYVSRESLLQNVWGDGFDSGVVNVYVHYLRNKLERDGRKIILSSRKEGYKIDEKYRRES